MHVTAERCSVHLHTLLVLWTSKNKCVSCRSSFKAVEWERVQNLFLNLLTTHTCQRRYQVQEQETEKERERGREGEMQKQSGRHGDPYLSPRNLLITRRKRGLTGIFAYIHLTYMCLRRPNLIWPGPVLVERKLQPTRETLYGHFSGNNIWALEANESVHWRC